MVERLVQPRGGGSIPTSPLHKLKKGDWWVEGCSINDARALVISHHYARGASNTATVLHGLFRRAVQSFDDLHPFGCAWWIPPTRTAAEAWSGASWEGVLALSRLVISPEVPSNACSFLLSKSARLIDRRRWHTLISYSDHWRVHAGIIYRAAGWEYAGETGPEATYTIGGRLIARKAGPSTRTHDEMLAMGCKFEGRFSKSRWVLH